MVFTIAYSSPNVYSSTVVLSVTPSIIPSAADTLDSVCAVYDCSDGDFDTIT
jgi:hypothetical protein